MTATQSILSIVTDHPERGLVLVEHLYEAYKTGRGMKVEEVLDLGFPIGSFHQYITRATNYLMIPPLIHAIYYYEHNSYPKALAIEAVFKVCHRSFWTHMHQFPA